MRGGSLGPICDANRLAPRAPMTFLECAGAGVGVMGGGLVDEVHPGEHVAYRRAYTRLSRDIRGLRRCERAAGIIAGFGGVGQGEASRWDR